MDCEPVANVTRTVMVGPKRLLVLLQTAVMEIETLLKASHILEDISHPIEDFSRPVVSRLSLTNMHFLMLTLT